jgi:hypothetical protein
VLQQLPAGLAIAVLAAARVDLERKMAILPVSLHPLAVEAAFPTIRRDHSLIFDFNCMWTTSLCTSQAVLHAATREACPLQRVDLRHIPLSEDVLLQPIADICMSASDVS